MTITQDGPVRHEETRDVEREPGLAGRLVVFSETPELPGWVHDWCDSAGRELCPRRRRATVPGHRPIRAPQPDVATGRATHTDAILVLPPGCAGHDVLEVTAALHVMPDDAPVLALAVDAARHVGARLVLGHGLPVSSAERSVGLRTALEDARRLLDVAQRQLVDEAPDVRVGTRLFRAHPYELVGEHTDTGLLVVGGPRRHDRDGLGVVAGSALHHATCPLLIVPR
jgi:nucleotide-binding universal stress UspA family protein